MTNNLIEKYLKKDGDYILVYFLEPIKLSVRKDKQETYLNFEYVGPAKIILRSNIESPGIFPITVVFPTSISIIPDEEDSYYFSWGLKIEEAEALLNSKSIHPIIEK